MASTVHVALDATSIPAERGGVGRYVDQLAAALSALGTNLTIITQADDADTMAAIAPGARIVPAPAGVASRAARFAWEQTGLPLLLRKVGANVLHAPHYTMPVAAGLPTVVTLHDATFFSDRHLHTGVKGPFFRSWSTLSLRRAGACVVPSQATADELARFTSVRPDRVVVAPHGVDATTFHPPTADEIGTLRERLQLDGEWIAFLGTLEPRKNVPALIRGFIEAVRERPDPPALVLAGGAGWDTQIDPELARVPSSLRVIRAGRLPIGLLPALLGGSVISCYPSLGEGFGLPVLESMACGAPTLTTRRLALPEVGGDAVAYCDVTDRDIATGLGTLLDDPDRREELSRAGLARAATFTWQACAQQHVRAYELSRGR